MAVYTEVSFSEASLLFQQLNLGRLTMLEGCSGGIENTNYFATAEQNGDYKEYVLTLFERLTLAQLPFYLRLMKHMVQRGIPVPEPSPNALGELVFEFNGKPAVVVNRLPGKTELDPSSEHRAQVAVMLAKMHLAGSDFELRQPNLRGVAWWNETVPVVLPYLSANQKSLIQQELSYQNQVAALDSYANLPRGQVHADLFRDNVMFDTVAGKPILSGFFDFYFAGFDALIFDLAVCLNDWCIDLQTGMINAQYAHMFIASYNTVRRLEVVELGMLAAMLRASALRFWLSRLWDFYLPRQASILKAHDPASFELILRQSTASNINFDRLETAT